MRALFAYDLHKDKFFLEQIGGLDVLDIFKERAEQATAKSCPFCGNNAEVRVGHSLSCITVAVRCESCKAQTRTYLTGTAIDGKKYSIIDAFNNALSDWNRRTAPLD